MKLTLIRHLKVDFEYNRFYTSRTFDQACEDYNNSVIVTGDHLVALTGKLYISSLKRTRLTALAHKRVDDIHTSGLLDEVPLRSFMNCRIPLPTSLWMIIGRVQWWFNCRRQPETKQETTRRINDFLRIIEMNNQDCTIIGHGFYFWHMSGLLLQRGYKGTVVKKMENGESAEFEIAHR